MRTLHLTGKIDKVAPFIGRLADERVWEHVREALAELQDAEQAAGPAPAAKTGLNRLADDRLWQHLAGALAELGGAAEIARGRKQHRWGMLLGGAALIAGAFLVSRAVHSDDRADG